MKELSLERMEEIEGGLTLVGKTCAVLALGSVVYGAGLAFNWWNPIGWVSAAALSADLVCGIYAFS